MKSHKKEFAIVLTLIFWISTFLSVPYVHAISTTSSTILLDVAKTDAVINGQQIQLEAPATIIADKMFVPAKFLGDAMDFAVKWDGASRTIRMSPPGYEIMLDSDHHKVTINGIDIPFASVAAIVNGKLLVKLTWVADYMGATYTYDDALRRVSITYTPHPGSIYVDKDGNSSPVAKFATAKLTYRMGEPVKYVDLSYDPDAEGITYQWTGRQDAFFAAGKYPVSLQVSDQHGHTSEQFTTDVTVINEPYLSEAQYPFYTTPVGEFILMNWGLPWSRFNELPALAKTAAPSADRKLLLSNSPEEYTQRGILYQDQVNGKARLYAKHINGTQQKMSMAIIATNHTDKPITVSTTHKSSVWSSVYENLIGDQTATDLLLNKDYEEKLVVPPNRTLIYSQIPNIYPGEETNMFYDIETDGELSMSFVVDEGISPSTLSGLFVLPPLDNSRGTFPATELNWNVDATSFFKASIITFGDNKTDPFIKGQDMTLKRETINAGNLGVVYKIHANKPRQMVIMALARGGIFKGTFKINGELVKVPASGVMTALDGMKVLARTTGKEDSLDIEFTPPAGSALPIDLVFYPLSDKQ